MTTRTLLRAGLVLLAAMQASVGLALVAPRAFYDGFPLPGHPWVALLPPYNEHLVRDVGGYSLAFAVALGAAAFSMDRRLVRVALLTLAVFAVPHAVYHAGHLQDFPPVDAVAQTAGTVIQLLLVGCLLGMTARLPSPAPQPATQPDS